MRRSIFLHPLIVTVLGAFASAPIFAQSSPVIVNLASIGSGPSPLMQATDGNLYGETSSAVGAVGAYTGTVFRLTPQGSISIIANFKLPFTGVGPSGGLVQAPDTRLYGVTIAGEAGEESGGGTIFAITLDGILTRVHAFEFTSPFAPKSGLVQSFNGDFYGSTTKEGPYGGGSIFSFNTTEGLTTIYNLSDPAGSLPNGPLTQIPDGTFYGTAFKGGAANEGYIFSITPGGAFTVLFNFDGTYGAFPAAPLLYAPNGNFYGTASNGGSDGDGTIFEITPAGAFTLLHSFHPQVGINPNGALVLASDGNIWGVASGAGPGGNGTIFKMTPGGVYSTIYSFLGGTDGGQPVSLTQATDGTFYTVNIVGGPDNSGAIAHFNFGLPPFVNLLPGSGKPGAVALILGAHLTGATAVTFNGAPAVFTVISPTEISAIVPAGAVTGQVQVTLPASTLSSVNSFQVITP